MFLTILDFDNDLVKIILCPIDVDDFNKYIYDTYKIKDFSFLITDNLSINI